MPAQASGTPELDTRPLAHKPSFLLPSTAGWEPRRSDVKAEPGSFFFTPPLGASPNGPRSGLISVAITLHPAAAEVRGPCPYACGAGSGGCRSPGQQGVMPDPWPLSGKWMGTSHQVPSSQYQRGCSEVLETIQALCPRLTACGTGDSGLCWR